MFYSCRIGTKLDNRITQNHTEWMNVDIFTTRIITIQTSYIRLGIISWSKNGKKICLFLWKRFFFGFCLFYSRHDDFSVTTLRYRPVRYDFENVKIWWWCYRRCAACRRYLIPSTTVSRYTIFIGALLCCAVRLHSSRLFFVFYFFTHPLAHIYNRQFMETMCFTCDQEIQRRRCSKSV